MKMFLVIYAEASDENIIGAFKSAGFKFYTKIQGATGEGEESEPKLGTHYWPGKNNTLYIAVHDEEIQHISDLIRELKVEHPRSCLRAFTFPIEECI